MLDPLSYFFSIIGVLSCNRIPNPRVYRSLDNFASLVFLFLYLIDSLFRVTILKMNIVIKSVINFMFWAINENKLAASVP